MRCVIISGSHWKCKKHNVRSKHFNAEHEAFRYWRIVLSEICQLSIRKEITNTVSVTWIAELNKHRNIHSDKKAQQCLQSRVCKKKRDYNSGKSIKVCTSTIKNLQGKGPECVHPQSRICKEKSQSLLTKKWKLKIHIIQLVIVYQQS